MEGRAENEMKKAYGEKSLGNKKTFNQEAMMTEILKGGGEANLAKVYFFKCLSSILLHQFFMFLIFIMYLGWKLIYLQVREQTNKRRQEISASLTTYGSATPQKAAIDTSPTSSTSGSAKASNPSNENTSSDTTTSTNASEASSSAASEK